MSQLSSADLHALTQRIHERLEEFGIPEMLPSRGVVRVAYEVFLAWKPKLPDPDVARERLAVAIATGSPNDLNGLRARLLNGRTVADADDDDFNVTPRERQRAKPTMDDVTAELKRLSMAGEMPSRTTYDNAKTPHLPTSATVVTSWGHSWADVAVMAGLKYSHRGRNKGEAA